MRNSFNYLLVMLSAALIFSSCNEDDDTPVLPGPTIENIELGLGNNETAVIGEDFHFEADVIAGDKIETVQINIRQIAGENYSGTWSFELVWDQYKDLKNTNIHKHFTIPEDALDGKYEFVITINDQNGESLEEIRRINIFSQENLPVNPQLAILSVFKNGDFIYRDGEFTTTDASFSKGDTLFSQATISGIEGDGKMYLLLIHEDANHHPEVIEDIDLSKVIVYDVFDHTETEKNGTFSNSIFDLETFTSVRDIPALIIGSEKDNNTPNGNGVVWKSGTYSYVMIYNNETYGFNLLKEISVEITL